MEKSKFYQIKNITEREYTLVGCDGSVITRPIRDVDKSASAFTIQDAKDGDVLCCESGWTCIFKTLVNDETFSSYCFMDNTKWFCETGSECHTLKEEFVKAYNGKIYPATKEQREQLEKAMADAGYTFDFEKKELKKIEDEYRADAIAEIKDEPQKELAETYLTVFDKKFPILPTLKGKQLADYKNFLNKCQQIFGLKYWGIRPLQAKLFEKLSLLWAAWGAEHLQGLGQIDGDIDNERKEWSEEDSPYGVCEYFTKRCSRR